MKRKWSLVPAIAFMFSGFAATAFGGENLGDLGTFDKWSKIEIEFAGPNLQGTGDPNPFAIILDVSFTGPSGRTYNVPGFYDGDGNGSQDGNIWKVRFSADEEGQWSMTSTSTDGALDGSTGSFEVGPVNSGAADFYRWGRLEAVATPTNSIRYLKFRDGPYWLKAGSDDPENFLGGFSNYDTNAERKAVIDYLSSKGINSQYLMTHNIGGDNNDVWPWLGTTTTEAKANGGANARFDLAKLEEWRDLFEHMQSKGVVVYMILEDDSAWSGYDHGRYYRELVARFGYLPALLFNIGEESNENYSLVQALAYAQSLEDLDPYDHPIGIHNVNVPSEQYVDASQVDFTAIQTRDPGDGEKHNGIVADWLALSEARSRRLLTVGFDEPRPLMDRIGWWSAYIGGGVWEVHVDRPYDRPVSTWETAWAQIGGARSFMETIPFSQMSPHNELVVSGKAFCLADPGSAYAAYLPVGGTVSLVLDNAGAPYDYDWWNPANDKNGTFSNTGVVNGGTQQFTAPAGGDWALRILASDGSIRTRPNPPENLQTN